MFERFGRRVEARSRSAHANAPVLIAALGDSVTQGNRGPGPDGSEAVFHHRLKLLLEQAHPKCAFNVLNAGIGGQKARHGLERLERDVIRFDPDLVTIGFGLNDCCDGLDRLGEFREAIEGIVAGIRGGCETEIILLTPNFMCTADNPNVSDEQRYIVKTFAPLQNEGVLAAYAEALREIGRSRGVAVADVHAAWQAMADAGEDTNAMLENGLNHPDSRRHKIPARLILELLEA